jgi:hypothetical protein
VEPILEKRRRSELDPLAESSPHNAGNAGKLAVIIATEGSRVLKTRVSLSLGMAMWHVSGRSDLRKDEIQDLLASWVVHFVVRCPLDKGGKT